MYEQYRNIQIEMDDDTLEYIRVRDMDLGAPNEDNQTPGEDISVEVAIAALEAMLPTTEGGISARISARVEWLRAHL